MSQMAAVVLCVLLLPFTLLADDLSYRDVKFKGYHTRFRVGFHPAQESDKATLLYMNGFTDQMGNHKELFKTLSDHNIRVVSFDYPGHGGSRGIISGWKLEEIAGVASRVLDYVKIDEDKPLILGGFSTGATIAIRMVQEWKHLLPFGVPIAGTVLIAPGVPVKLTAGTFGVVTERQLTRGRLNHKPKPVTTTFGGQFVTSLLFESNKARKTLFPKDIPAVVLLADEDEDGFNHVKLAEKWVTNNTAAGRKIYAYKCKGAYHALEFEPNGIGRLVRRMVQKFSIAMAQESPHKIKKAAQFFATNNYVCPAQFDLTAEAEETAAEDLVVAP